MLAATASAAAFWLRRPAFFLARLARWGLALIALAWCLLLLAGAILHGAILPHIDEWRPTLEKQASQRLGIQVRIGSIAVGSGSIIPALELREVRLLDAQGREALRLPRVVAALSARSLLSWRLYFSQLLIDGPQLEIRRSAQGQVFIAGFNLDAPDRPEQHDGAWADWFFSQHEFVILNGQVRWIDELRGGPQAAPLDLSALNLVVRNGLRQHSVRLDATPPPAWGRRFALRGRFNQNLLKRPGELQFWTGQLFADLPLADLRELRRHVDLPFELSEGDGALRAWIDIKNGQAQGATVDLGLRAVRMRLQAKAEELQLERIEGRLQLVRDAQKLSLKAQQLGFVSVGNEGPGVVWPRSDWGVSLLLPAAKGAPTGLAAPLAEPIGGTLNAQRLDFALMAQIIEKMPVGSEARRLLGELAPRGVVSQLDARWDGALDAPRSYRVKALLEGLQLDAKPAEDDQHLGRPGLRGARVELDASERGGQARLAIADGELDFPGLFDEPQLPLKQLGAAVAWRIDPRAGAGKPAALEVKVSDLRLANADLQAEFDGLWRSGDGEGSGARHARFPGYLELNGRIDRVDATRVQRYLPRGVGAGARSYVKEAIRGGTAQAVSFKVQGALADFPFDTPAGRAGQFRIATQARDIELAYVPAAPGQPLAWPALEHIDAELIFERGGMQIRNGRAKVMGYELSGINGGIKDLAHHATLEIEGAGRGPLAELLRFVRSSPVDGWTDHALSQASSTGMAGLKLALKLPLADIDHAGVKGTVLLQGNDLRLRPNVPLLGNARAAVDFSVDGVTVQGGQARILGGDATFEGGSQRDGSLRFSGQGVASAEALRRAPELGALARLATAASGQTAYKLQLGIVGKQLEMNLSSPLQGLGLDLPAPLRKEEQATLPLRVQIALQPGSSNSRDELKLELGSLLQAQYQRDISGDTPRVLRGALGVLAPAPALPASGVQLQANLDVVNLDALEAAANRLGASPASVGGAGGADGLDGGYTPNQIGLKAQQLTVSGRQLNKVAATLTRLPEPDGGWRAQLDAEQLSGSLELRAARGSQPARIQARLARLSLPKQEADSVSQMLEQQPGAMPTLDIVVEDFELRDLRLGRLEVQASGSARDWRLNRLQLRGPDAVLNATGRWLNDGARITRHTVLDWKLDVSDAGNLLERLGQGRVLRAGKGHLSGQIGWQGSPLSLDYPSLAGQLKLELGAGQFLKVEPGVGRLLGVLSLQSLPRRFLLDFRDVFSEGFAFDSVQGDVSIEHGLATSHDLRVAGVQAAVLLDGHADLAAETQDLRVLVVPEINAGGAALAYAAVNPAIGLGAFLAQLVLSRPMAAAGTREFHITGSWDEPKVEQVERGALEANRPPVPPSPPAAASAANRP